MSSNTCLALDLGGTKLLIGEVEESGRILKQKRYDTGYLTQAEEIERIQECLDDYIRTVGFAGERPDQMGMGLIGQIDHSRGVWVMIDDRRRIPTPVTGLFQEKYGMRCQIDNDVKSAALAQKRFGAAKDTDHFIYLNIGTGIGAGFFENGRLIRGWQNDSGEVGHLTVDFHSDTVCFCGRRGCVEAISSGSGISSRFFAKIGEYPDSALRPYAEEKTIPAHAVFEAAKEGDPLAGLLTRDAADGAAALILDLVRVSNPEKIILGGGVISNPDFYRMVCDRLDFFCMKSVLKGVELSQLDPQYTGLLGAAAVGFED